MNHTFSIARRKAQLRAYTAKIRKIAVELNERGMVVRAYEPGCNSSVALTAIEIEIERREKL